MNLYKPPKYFLFVITITVILACSQTSLQEINKRTPDTKKEFLQKYSVALNQYFIEYERRVIQNYIRRHHHQGQITSYGFFEEKCQTSTSKIITPKDKALIHGKVSTIDGELLYEYNADNPLFIQLNASNDFVGLHKALVGKRVGEKWKFIFPSYLGYGQVGDGKNIGKNVILVVELEILRFNN